jgi:hypothetical protein
MGIESLLWQMKQGKTRGNTHRQQEQKDAPFVDARKGQTSLSEGGGLANSVDHRIQAICSRSDSGSGRV